MENKSYNDAMAAMCSGDLFVPAVPLAAHDDECSDDSAHAQPNPQLGDALGAAGRTSDGNGNQAHRPSLGTALLDDCAVAKCQNNRLNDNSLTDGHNNFVHFRSRSRSHSPHGILDENLGQSLEELVCNFDDNIGTFFKDYQRQTEQFAPVARRTETDIMTESQTWYTLTGQFGNILPLDFSRPNAHKHSPPLSDTSSGSIPPGLKNIPLTPPHDTENGEVAERDSAQPASVVQSAEQVIQEIDAIMTGSDSALGDSAYSVANCGSVSDFGNRTRNAAELVSTEKDLWGMRMNELSAFHTELTTLVQAYNEALVQELALRDELEYDKELKHTFISLLLAVQQRRREYVLSRRRSRRPLSGLGAGCKRLPHFVTVSVPMAAAHATAPSSLAALCNLLRAVHDDSPAVPAMLTDYILKGRTLFRRKHSIMT